MSDTIYRQDAIDELVRWGKIPEYNDGERNIIACTIGMLSSLPSAQPEQIARDIATIIENEQDMRVLLKNERTETHSCDSERTETHESCTDCPLYDHDRHNCPRFNRVIPTTILDAQQRWIPVEDGEPLEDQECWFTVNDRGFRYVHHGSFTCRYGERRDKGFITGGGFAWWNTAIAWMPINRPEAWRGEQDENDRR